jgi:glycosyltransferase involved in cell wall biosynthesis
LRANRSNFFDAMSPCCGEAAAEQKGLFMPATYGFLSTYPPTQCGLATFNAALATHLNTGAGGNGVVRLLAGDDHGGLAIDKAAPRVVHTWPTDTPGGWRAAANALGRFDVAIVQHEYGIYPGDAGEEVLPLLRALKVPTIVVLHTVLSTPDPLQRSVLERIVAAADAVVTMTDTARQRLTTGYQVDPRKITVIPHGAGSHSSAPRDRGDRPHLLTWGLLGPGKGIEWALRSLAELQDMDPAPTYTVAGRTHPKVLEQRGDVYRDSLKKLAADLGVAEAVRWEDVYLDQAALSRLIRSADAVVLPYDSTEQVTSGVLIEAVGAGVPVVATEFPHAVELLADGPGLLVPHQDPVAMAAAIRRLLADPESTGRMTGLSGGPTLRWPAVAARYRSLAERLLADRMPVPASAGVPA